MNILYLHGLASSPNSSKARFFAQNLGAPVVVPDLNAPSFEQLTLTAMLARVAETVDALPAGELALIGSSMGGLTALHFADRYRVTHPVSRLVLLAPALDFIDNRSRELTAEGLEQWKRDGSRKWFHYGYNEERAIHYRLVEDVAGYDSYAVQLDIPVLIYHGLHDESVDYRQSERFAQGRASVDLRLLDSDHQLLDKTQEMLDGIRRFLGITT
jgi:uncharacterized protein